MKTLSMCLVVLKLAVGLSGLTYLTSCSATTSAKKDFLTSYDGLKQESKSSDSVTYRGDMVEMRQFKNIYLESVVVREPLKMAKKEVTKKEIAALEAGLRNALAREVSKSKFKLKGRKGKDTLSVRVAVTDFTPGSPKLFTATYAPYLGMVTGAYGILAGKTVGAGTAIVEAEIIDSVSRKRYFSIIDKDTGNKLQLASGMSRYGHINKSFDEWAKRMVKEIKEEPSKLKTSN